MYTVNYSHELPDAQRHTLEDPGPKPVMRLSEEQGKALRRLLSEPHDSVDGYALIDEGSGYKRLIRFETQEARKVGEALIFADGGCAGWQETDS
jgi:hypothetical protein